MSLLTWVIDIALEDSLSVIVGVAGGSGSGKSTFTHLLASLFQETALVISQDHFYHDQSLLLEKNPNINFDHPTSIDFYALKNTIFRLKQGLVAWMPQYDFKTHRRLHYFKEVNPSPIIFIEGTLILCESLGLDEQIFIHCEEALRFKRRLHRDISERGRLPEDIERQFFSQVKPMHDQFIEPFKNQCRLVDGSLPLEEFKKEALKIKQEILKSYSKIPAEA